MGLVGGDGNCVRVLKIDEVLNDLSVVEGIVGLERLVADDYIWEMRNSFW